ncbi:MAG: hypothetical protein C4343_02990, partial [Chloroflexota bacterium]
MPAARPDAGADPFMPRLAPRRSGSSRPPHSLLGREPHDRRNLAVLSDPTLGPMLVLVLTRHGLTDRSTPEQHLGQRIDVPLSAAGRTQAERLP